MCIEKGWGTRFVGDHIGGYEEGDVCMMGPQLPHEWRNDKEFFDEDSGLRATCHCVYFRKELFEGILIRLPEMSNIRELIERSRRGILFTGESRERIARYIRQTFNRDGVERVTNLLTLLEMMAEAKEWNDAKGVYECYLYPETSGYKPSERVGVMSNGLCAVLGASAEDQIVRMVENFPLYPYGAAVLYPSIPDDFAYHNKSVWPVWQTPYMYAACRTGNMSAVEHMMASLTRASALFLTHKENMTYDTGYDRGTALNSDRQLWSVSSYISMVYRVLFGMNLTERGLAFNPVVPGMVNGWLSLSDFPSHRCRQNADTLRIFRLFICV